MNNRLGKDVESGSSAENNGRTNKVQFVEDVALARPKVSRRAKTTLIVIAWLASLVVTNLITYAIMAKPSDRDKEREKVWEAIDKELERQRNR